MTQRPKYKMLSCIGEWLSTKANGFIEWYDVLKCAHQIACKLNSSKNMLPKAKRSLSAKSRLGQTWVQCHAIAGRHFAMNPQHWWYYWMKLYWPWTAFCCLQKRLQLLATCRRSWSCSHSQHLVDMPSQWDVGAASKPRLGNSKLEHGLALIICL